MPESSPKNKDLRSALLKYAANILSRRPYFYAQLKTKLQQRVQKLEFSDSDDVIRDILEDLQKSGYLNDTYLAEGYARRCLSRGQGPKLIKYKLQNLGLTSSQISATLSSESCLEAISEAKSKIMAKFSKDEEFKARHKLYQRGF